MANKLTKAEKETIVLTSEADDTWSIYTCSAPLKNRLRKFSEKCPEVCWLKAEDREFGSATYIVSKSGFALRFFEPYSKARRKSAGENARRSGFVR